MNDRIRSLYHSVIIKKAKDFKYVGELENPTFQLKAYNPLCGDKYLIQFVVSDGVIRHVKYIGAGCAISKASTAVLCETLEGAAIPLLDEKIVQFLEIIDEKSTRLPEEITDDDRLLAFASARQFPERKTCADLAWTALKAHLEQH